MRTSLIIAALLLTAWAPHTAAAAEPEKAEALLRAVAEQLEKAEAASVDVAWEIHTRIDDEVHKDLRSQKVAAAKPNLYAVYAFDGEWLEDAYVADGTTVHHFMRELNGYRETPAGGTMEEAVGGDSTAATLLVGPAMSGGYDALFGGFTELSYEGAHSAGVMPVHLIHAKVGKARRIIYLSQTEPPLMVRMDYAGGSTSASSKFSNWLFNDDVPRAMLTFTPPPGIEKLEPFDHDALEVWDRESEPSPLIGKPAPDFRLETMDEKTVTLKDHIGKDVVLLNFWGTWCGYSLQYFVPVHELAKEYSEQGLVYYTIVSDEHRARPVNALAGYPDPPPVLADTRKLVWEEYFLAGVPAFILIDKKGTITTLEAGTRPQTLLLLDRAIRKALEE